MRLLAIPVLLSVLVACVADVGKDKVQAEVADVPEAEKAAPVEQIAPDTVFVVDAAASKLEALGAKITAEHPIVFKDYTGKIGTTDGELVSVSFVVQMATLEADHPKLTAHLKDADFFDVASHPTAAFTSTAVSKGTSEAGMTHTVTGDFTIRGTTKRITFPAKVTVTDDKVVANTEFVLNRQDFGVTYPGRPDDLVQDNVRMTIAFTAVPKG